MRSFCAASMLITEVNACERNADNLAYKFQHSKINGNSLCGSFAPRFEKIYRQWDNFLASELTVKVLDFAFNT